MRAYNVQIVADLDGKEVRFVEVIAFPLESTGLHGCVKEEDREDGAIQQVMIKYPQLSNIRVEWSRHVSSDMFDKEKARPYYIPFSVPRSNSGVIDADKLAAMIELTKAIKERARVMVADREAQDEILQFCRLANSIVNSSDPQELQQVRQQVAELLK